MPPPPIQLASPLPAGDLLFESMTASGGLSQLGEIQLNLVSRKGDLKPQDLLGKSVTITVQLRDDSKRHFNGFVTRFGIGANRGRWFGYQATVHAWLWFLTRTADCRIFQNKSVPDIVKDVFHDSGFSNYDFKLFRSYRKWVYCVQYRETDFNFVSRLLEHEGIYWYFVHEDGKHKLVLVDSHSAHDAAPGCKSLPFLEEGAATAPDTECVSRWNASDEMQSGKAALRSFDFERPSTVLDPSAKRDGPWRLDKAEVFDWQGDFIQLADGKQLADDRIDELQLHYQVTQGSSNAHGIEVGRLLSLTHHPRADQNADYLVTSVAISAHVDAYESGNTPGGFQCHFAAIPAAQQFRPLRRTPKPFVQGPQTAVVVGPSGEEIFTDKYGRVKVQFHWDRLGKKDEKSSCWVRVSHPWAGKNFGVIDIPRMGQEVIVDFLEGDPDQPIITGRVYNAEQMPPWDLPANATQSGILTRSSKGGGYGNANAVRFEDKKGSEQLWIHAEKNQDIEVEHDETHWVGHDRTKTIDHDETTHVKHDRTETVDNNETITIHGNRTETVDKDETITIHKNRTETVDLNENITIGVNRTESVGSNETISIGSNRSITVGASETATVALQRTHMVGVNETIAVGAAQEVAIGGLQSITVGAVQSTTVGASRSVTVAGSQTHTVGGSQNITVAGGRNVKVGGKLASSVASDETRSVAGGRGTDVGKDDSLKVNGKLAIDAGESISITTGSASIVMKKDGTITIKGKDITIEASGKVNVKADANIAMKGSKIEQN